MQLRKKFNENLCTFTFQFIFLNSIAQNLITNGGFETSNNCPSDLGQITYATGWADQNGGNADYFNTCSTNHFVTVPDNYCGNAYPHTGNAYAGFCLVKQSFFEFIQTKFSKPLEPSKTYCLELFIQKSTKSPFSFNELALLFSKEQNKSAKPEFYLDKVIHENNLIIYEMPQYLKNEWTVVCIAYKPKAREEYLSIGFNKPKKIEGINPQQLTNQDSYYFVDDISLTELKKGGKCACKQIDTTSKYNAGIGKYLALQNITFITNSAVLLPTSYVELNKLATYLQAQLQLKITLSGHTDNTGKEEDNLKLSEERAKAVAVYLMQQGVEQSRISYKGYGSNKPVTDNSTETNRLKNRRVEIFFK